MTSRTDRSQLLSRPRGRTLLRVAVWLSLGACLVAPLRAQSGFIPYELSGVPQSPRADEFLERAKLAVANADWEKAIDFLQQLQENPDDFLAAGPQVRSVRGLANQAIKELPLVGRQQYERRFQEAAATMLATAREQGSIDGLHALIRIYPRTPAGRQAAYELARLYFDRGETLTAALLFSDLTSDPGATGEFGDQLRVRAAVSWLRSDAITQAAAELATLPIDKPVSLEIAGRTIQLKPSAGEPLEQLRAALGQAASEFDPGTSPPATFTSGPATSELLIYRGAGTRNVNSSFAPPLGEPTWRVSTVDELDSLYPERVEDVRKLLASQQSQLIAEQNSRGAPLLATGVPLVVGDSVIVHGPDKVRVRSQHG
ncbi:MAG: hypothetical protein R3B90_04360 [Planctomycetaceae bacterium]